MYTQEEVKFKNRIMSGLGKQLVAVATPFPCCQEQGGGGWFLSSEPGGSSSPSISLKKDRVGCPFIEISTQFLTVTPHH